MNDPQAEMIKAVWDAVGVWSLPVIFVIFAVRLWRMPGLQSALPKRLRWSETPLWVRLLAVGALSAAGSVATSLATGEGWGAALVAALPIAFASVIGHKTTKAVGHTMQAVAQEKAGYLDYKPSKFRRAASIVVPLDHRKIIRKD